MKFFFDAYAFQGALVQRFPSSGGENDALLYYTILGGLRAGVHFLPHGHDGPLAVLDGRRNSGPGVGVLLLFFFVAVVFFLFF